MNLLLVRILFIISSTLIGYQALGPKAGLFGALLGAVFSLVIIFVEIGMGKVSMRGLSLSLIHI